MEGKCRLVQFLHCMTNSETLRKSPLSHECSVRWTGILNFKIKYCGKNGNCRIIDREIFKYCFKGFRYMFSFKSKLGD